MHLTVSVPGRRRQRGQCLLPSWDLRKAIENALAKKESATILPVPIIEAVRKSQEVTMKSFVKILVAVFAVLMSVTAWAETAEEMEFAKSRYGVEMQSMVDVCIDMQRNGDLPGIRGGEDLTMEFGSESVDFSKKDDVVYPLQLQCMVIKDAEMLAFTFNKETVDADWTLVQ
ncbi:MAG: hypothetical protein OXR07_07790 [Nitrospira sp.]|nr:hypothetical protein [Nitrospira sp.]MDD9860313.1 hypothetical protein [Nitrospira sp.]